MPTEREFLDILSGQTKGAKASLARGGLAAIEPFYASAMRVRNALFDRGIKPAVDLGRPAISVGNLTTGGTGKTPVVQWLARRLIAKGKRPAVLLRGYKSKDGVSDEAELYRAIDGLEVEANPDRIAGAGTVLKRTPAVDVFLLNDAFQHRRAKRNFDLVLIDASNPFGHGHVLPRGLLREPMSGLSRASAILITHADDRDDALLARLRSLNAAAPIFHCRHAIHRLIDANGLPVDRSGIAPVAAVAGIGNPGAFFEELATRLHLPLSASIALPDHVAFDNTLVDRLNADLAKIRTVIVTEKDWVKLRALADRFRPTIARAVLELDFADGHAETLGNAIEKSLFAN
ncbi:MAG: tetraacyldisaccharide 4'-kinase [Tepidisphaeraceae bacterium]